MTIIKNITVTKTFSDGNLADVFKRLGYPATWRAGERRDLPDDILKRVVVSGGQITIADPNARESKIVEGAEPQPDNSEVYTKLYGKGKRVRVVFPEGFKDGSFTEALAALNHPAEIGVGEILELPLPLLERIAASGGLYSTDPEEIQQAINSQGKYQQRVREWQAEQERAKSNNAKRREIAEHNSMALAEIETLSAEYIKATGNMREALWNRIAELKQSLR